MYSVILMAAMTTTTADAPQWGRKGGGGCYGALYLHSGGYGSCMGCWGACYGCYGGCYGGYGAGCYGCMGCHGSWFGYGDYMTPYAPYAPAGNPVKPVSTDTGTPPATGATGRAAGAKLIIEKPADAQVYVDGRPVRTEGTAHAFATPALDPSQDYYYMVKVEMTRDGKPVSETRRVVVRAGETTTEAFREPRIETASLKIPLEK